MTKSVQFALAALVTAAFLSPAPAAFAGDHGPCDHCTMEPIVVKGDRGKKKDKQQTGQQIRSGFALGAGN